MFYFSIDSVPTKRHKTKCLIINIDPVERTLLKFFCYEEFLNILVHIMFDRSSERKAFKKAVFSYRDMRLQITAKQYKQLMNKVKGLTGKKQILSDNSLRAINYLYNSLNSILSTIINMKHGQTHVLHITLFYFADESIYSGQLATMPSIFSEGDHD